MNFEVLFDTDERQTLTLARLRDDRKLGYVVDAIAGIETYSKVKSKRVREELDEALTSDIIPTLVRRLEFELPFLLAKQERKLSKPGYSHRSFGQVGRLEVFEKAQCSERVICYVGVSA